MDTLLSLLAALLPLIGLLPAATLVQQAGAGGGEDTRPSLDELRAAGAVIGIDLTDPELELMHAGVAERLGSLERLRAVPVGNDVAPVGVFSPLLPGMEPRVTPPEAAPREAPDVHRPADLAELLFADIDTLGALVKGRQVSCVELTELFLARLSHVDETLHCVITLLPERARAQAAVLDRELEEGRWRGPLHGIPWGAKDLLAVSGARTTWGAVPFEDQVLDTDAEVVRRLDEAGAVLLAKLSLGALAWGDVWFGGMTRNPWNPEQGSSGSSAGSAAAVAAGGVVFAIGSETYGSIVSPSVRCGCSSLRPTFGRVSRRGAMALSWSMDKLGPMARSARDAALVLDAIEGRDPQDETTEAAARFAYTPPGPADVGGWRIGYIPADFGLGEDGQPLPVPGEVQGEGQAEAQEDDDEDDAAVEAEERRAQRARREAARVAERAVLDELSAMGAELVPVTPPALPLEELLIILHAEAAESFNKLTLDGRDDSMVRQIEQAWPNVFRTARLIPAVEYLRAQRVRRLLMREVDGVIGGLDALVHPPRGPMLLLGNLTGHPTAVFPIGFRDDGTPRGICLTGRLYDEARLMALAEAYQRRTEHHRAHPSL
ncbi:MAG: amidase [Planctomycetota bacterium]|jgi:Asp-tRNA(Asn)/Glu-tRNA(Gln) amidotransferase A subunit family amidase